MVKHVETGELMVFPAPAGMNRTHVGHMLVLGVFPRTCGDEPVTDGHRLTSLVCSPHLRG